MRGSSALPKAKAKAKAKAKKTIAKYAYLPPDLRGAAKILDEKNLITNINKVMNRDGRVETLLPRGDDPAHVGRVLGDIARRIDGSGRSAPSERADRSVAAMTPIPEGRSRARFRSVGPQPVQYGGSSSSTADPLGLFS
jgi:hypothetical protein